MKARCQVVTQAQQVNGIGGTSKRARRPPLLYKGHQQAVFFLSGKRYANKPKPICPSQIYRHASTLLPSSVQHKKDGKVNIKCMFVFLRRGEYRQISI